LGFLFHLQPLQIHGQDLPNIWEADTNNPMPVILPPIAIHDGVIDDDMVLLMMIMIEVLPGIVEEL
jgi:hypothetical protein